MSKATGSGLPKPIGVHITTSCALDARHGATGFSVCPSEFWLCFDSIPPYPIPQFGDRNVYSVPCVLELCNFLFDFMWA
jgi:hypothetical protein